MNRYPLWKYILIVFAVMLGALYTAPNLFGDSPALQITSLKETIKVDPSIADQVNQLLKNGAIKAGDARYEVNLSLIHI